jgi:ribosomal protein L37E
MARADDLPGSGSTATTPFWLSRPGAPTLVLGGGLLLVSVLATVVLDDVVGLGVMLLLTTFYGMAGYLLLIGLVRLRSGDGGAYDDVATPGMQAPAGTWQGAPGARSRRCWTAGHQERFVARSAEAPPHWECRRCGAQSLGHLRTGRAWRCHVVEHQYDRVLASSDVPVHWRCRRCGRRRFTEPRSAGETLEGSHAEGMWIRRGENS